MPVSATVLKGNRQKRRLKAKFRECTSLAFVANAIGRFARQSIVLLFTFFELVSMLYAVWFYLQFKEIALNGWIMKRWKVYVICLSFRLLCSLLGFFAAFMRKIRLMRYYYAAMLPNIMFTFMAMSPLARTKCTCVSFIQCQVLIAFTGDYRHLMINPYPPPDRPKWATREVPYADPPSEAFSSRVWRLNTGSDESVFNLSASTSHLVKNTSLSQLTAAISKPIASSLVNRPKKAPAQADNPATFHLHYLNDFTVSKPDVFWVSRSKRCTELNPTPNDTESTSVFRRSLEELRSMKIPKASVFKPTWNDALVTHLGDGLHHCVQDPRCGIINLYLLKGMRFKTCLLDYPTVPVPLNAAKRVTSRTAPNPSVSISLQKHHLRAQEDTVNITNHLAVEDIDTLKAEVAWQKLRGVYEDSCRCHPHFPTSEKPGCQVWNNGKHWKSWCVIEDRSVPACLRNGIAVFQHTGDGEPHFYWSEDLCRKRSCRCSGLGLPPSPTNKHVNRSKLHGFGFNYGKTCKRWDTEDEEDWCYVGFDTTCPDRKKDVVEAANAHGQPEKVSQYYSAYACVNNKQHGLLRSYRNQCQTLVGINVLLLVSLNIISLPMLILIFKFLVNRCGDHFAVDDQFNVQFSSDEEHDDFEIGGDEESNPSHRNKTPLKSALKKPAIPVAEQDAAKQKSFAIEKSDVAKETDDAENRPESVGNPS